MPVLGFTEYHCLTAELPYYITVIGKGRKTGIIINSFIAGSKYVIPAENV